MNRSRVGLLMKKIGCSAIFDETRNRIPVTILQLEDNIVLSTKAEGDLSIIEVSFGALKNVKKPQRAYFEKLGIENKGRIRTFRLNNNNNTAEANTEGSERNNNSDLPLAKNSFTVEHFDEGQYVDVCGISIGKGFAGVMKRHNFKGLRASHGVSRAHRSGGSTGQCQDPGKTYKGKKMAGHMGHQKVTVQNLIVQNVNLAHKLIAIKGSVPGPKGSYVLVQDAIKKSRNL